MGMVEVRPGPVTYKFCVGVIVLNKQVGYMKAASLQVGGSKMYTAPREKSERLVEPVGPLSPSRVEEILESEVDAMDIAALTPLPDEEASEFLSRCFGHQ
eukprot:g46868.t1